MVGGMTFSDRSAACFGYLSDHMRSRQVLLVFGLVTFAGSTAMLCVGTSIALFVAGRALQGMSAAIVWTAGLALLADNVDKEEVGKCLGFVSLSMCGGTFLGPLLGGIVYDKGGYYAVYAMAFGLIGFDLFLRLVLIERSKARKYMDEDDDHDASVGPSSNADSHSIPEEFPKGATSTDRKMAERSEAARYTDEEDYPGDSVGPSSSADSHGMPEGIPKEATSTDREMAISQSDPTKISNSVVWKRRYPPILWLLKSRRLLVALFASMIFGTMLTAFDAVRQNLTLTYKFISISIFC